MLFAVLGVLSLAAVANGQCGGNLIESSGDVNSPGYPNGYGPNLDCMWTIPARGGSVTVEFKDFSIEEADTFLFFTICNNDKVEIIVGESSEGTYCGTDMPMTITASEDIHIRFVSDDMMEGMGFSFSYVVQYGLSSVPCGAHVNDSGTAMSPNYPNNYPDNQDCTWTIPSTQYGYTVTFTDFMLESASFFAGCYDYVDVFEGATKLGRFCGSNPPPTVTSANEIRIKFFSDGSVQDRGFQFDYLKLDTPITTIKPQETTKADGSGDDMII